jgi:hypothetical protein
MVFAGTEVAQVSVDRCAGRPRIVSLRTELLAVDPDIPPRAAQPSAAGSAPNVAVD